MPKPKEPSRPPGRPSKLKPEVKEKFLQLLRQGNEIGVAARSVGIGFSTICEWRQIGRGEHPTRYLSGVPKEYSEFSEECDQAIADAEAMLVRDVRKAAQSDWKAASWMLTRHHPERWSERRYLQKKQQEFEAQKAKPTSLEDIAIAMQQHGLIDDEQFASLMKVAEEAKEKTKQILSSQNAQDGDTLQSD